MRQLLSFIFILSLSYTSINCADAKQNQTINQQVFKLLQDHQSFLNQYFKKSSLSSNEKDFFSNINFMKDNMTQNFFQNIKANIESGRTAIGLMQLSYTKFVSINGHFTGVQYSYKSDGKNIFLSKSSNLNGKILKTIYNYNPKGKLLRVEHFGDNKLQLKKEHTFKI